MRSDGKAYLCTVGVLVVAFSVVTWFYAAEKSIPRWISAAFLTAATLEAACYAATGFRKTRELFDSVAPALLRAILLAVSAVAPYAVYAGMTGTLRLRPFLLLAVLVSAASAWFVVARKRSAWSDILFLVFMAAVLLSKVFDRVYVELHPRVPAEILGQLMWIRTGVFAVLSFRKLGGIGFGFVPSRRDWSIGVQQFLMFIPVGILLGMWLHFAQPRTVPGPWWKTAAVAAGTFLGILWVVALSEEFFFRGVLQQAVSRLVNSRWVGLLVASVAFGLVHLPFRQFPNWRMALLAGVAGLTYGIAYMRSGSIRAPMVSHALVVTTWRVFFG